MTARSDVLLLRGRLWAGLLLGGLLGGCRLLTRCRLLAGSGLTGRLGRRGRGGGPSAVSPEQALAGLRVEQMQMLGVEPQLRILALPDRAGGVQPSDDLVALLLWQIGSAGVVGELLQLPGGDLLRLDHEVG